ncbi:DUF5825 family protein [Parafrankia elaeagni]|uniref:DUF5825 family protein n=1 Tax=Parafrankia elaeagni TaxID=222534 RepID=UPI00035D5910|nr:DUF5825 family protein [Parafrankia elaeagni]
MQPPSDDLGAPSDDLGVTVELWRDYARAALALPGMALGTRQLTGDWSERAAELYGEGARYARVAEPVPLCGDAPVTAVRSLTLISELTARGFAVHWIARCDEGCADHGALGHLFPPAWIFGASKATTARWRRGYFPGRCVFRHGPGFVEVRDRRFGPLERHVFDDPETLDVIETLIGGIAVERMPAELLRELAAARLVLGLAGCAWWVPTRIYRWPFPAQVI